MSISNEWFALIALTVSLVLPIGITYAAWKYYTSWKFFILLFILLHVFAGVVYNMKGIEYYFWPEKGEQTCLERQS